MDRVYIGLFVTIVMLNPVLAEDVSPSTSHAAKNRPEHWSLPARTSKSRPSTSPVVATRPMQPATSPADVRPWTATSVGEDTDTKAGLLAVYFVDDKTGWAVGGKGMCLTTNDSGKTWQKLDTNSKATLRGLFFLDDKTGWLCGDSDPDAPVAKMGHVVGGVRPRNCSTLLSTTDGGKTWEQTNIPTNFELTSLAGVDDKSLLIGNSGGDMHLDGDASIFTKKDGGTLTASRVYRALFATAALDEKNWVAAGSPISVGFMPPPTDELYTQNKERVIYSDDGKATWRPSKGSEGAGCLRAIAWRKELPMLAVGDRGAILISDDKGANWSKVDSPTKKSLRGVAWGAGKSPMAVAVGLGGTVIASTDGGKKWNVVPLQSPVPLTAVATVGDTFVAVTADGMILRIQAAELVKAAQTRPTE